MKVHVVAACDPGFAQHLAVMLLSLAETNARHELSVFVLWNGPTAEKDKLREVLAGTPFAYTLIDLSDGALSDLAGGVNFTVTTYARLLIGDHLPREVDRVLYLDGDILVRGDLQPLWSTNLEGRTAAAVTDLPRYEFNSTLGLPADALYFNAGVLLIDLARWRRLDIGARALAFSRQHPDRLRWCDQCALNFILHDDWVLLDRVWNFQSMDVAHVVNGHVRFDSVRPDRLAAARIIHFNGRSKPWHYLNDHPLKGEYLRYRRRTPWPVVRFEDRHPGNIARKYLLRYAPAVLEAYGELRKLAGLSAGVSTPTHG
jgi:lipopolysaccharide biosynthesis glycosyltransferase